MAEEYILKPQPVQQQFLNCDQDIVFYGGGGGGGKTWAILVDNLRFVEDPNYHSVFFRNTTTELETNLWPEAKKMYTPLLKYQSGPLEGKYIGHARIKEKEHTIIFPSGAVSRFSYLQYDKDADNWYGAEISRAYFDEFQRRICAFIKRLVKQTLLIRGNSKQARLWTIPSQAHKCGKV